MRFDLHLRSQVRDQFQALASEMQSWQTQPRIQEVEVERLRSAIVSFDHTIERTNLTVAGVDGSGDFPLLSYADSFIYLAVAQGTVYQADRLCGLRELPPAREPLFQTVWLTEDTEMSDSALDRVFGELAGMSPLAAIQESDYRTLKAHVSGRRLSSDRMLAELIRPHASDASNLAIQLRSTAEFGAALQLLAGGILPKYLLVDTTFSLPLVSNAANSLFYEHLKRLCCVRARSRGVGFFALSKSHGLPAMEVLEDIVRDVQERDTNEVAEHWYLRIPKPERDGWQLSLTEGRRMPPPGTVSYLVRFHRTTPVMRLDMDLAYWESAVKGASEAETRSRERTIFEDLDYACHDQRVYGYPYPIKAAHDRASLTQAERVTFRKQLVAAAVKQGMSPSLFRDPSRATGHR
ncbi:hypothetical protein PN498_04330 [Oscillatoria sp. CS-180]|uniref:hypothetical protein n=1 Tax=Oscillatoria sp. CS-180 TaxID=3021720 RepID=UPI00232C1B45|nr:hypothetical protein [Oscillatoria sp. CS-180]MDB9525203.1 hypothetical protein [Oscillatoria sp. CS-180]